MRRREFIAGLAGAALAPLAGQGQETGRRYRLAVLTQSSRTLPHLAAFFDELRLLGFVEGQNLEVVPAGFDVRVERLPEQAANIVGTAPDAIVTTGELATRTAQAATRSIPILGGAEDMVAAGLVASLARPGGNVTGSSMLSPELDGKRQDILIEVAPDAKRIAALADASQISTGAAQHLNALRSAARARGIELSIFSVSKPEQIPSAITEAKATGSKALNVLASPLFSANRRIIFERVLTERLPAIFQWPDMAHQGGLIAYGPSLPEIYRKRARMAAKVLGGTKPADIPVEQPTNFELVVNLKTAKVIGHEVPTSLVLRADQVIE